MIRIIILTVLPERQEYYEYLKEKLPEAEFCFDTEKHAMKTFISALEMVGDDPAIFMEDDCILTENFVEKAEKAIQERPDEVIQFFSMRIDDFRLGSRYLEGSEYFSNCCFYLPKGVAKEILKFAPDWIEANKEKNPTAMDYLVRDFLIENQLNYFNHVPSLVQHRIGKSSIDSTRPERRVSTTFKKI